MFVKNVFHVLLNFLFLFAKYNDKRKCITMISGYTSELWEIWSIIFICIFDHIIVIY